MSTTSSSHTEPGQLLTDLELRQDDVLSQLDDLDAKLTEVLKGLGVSEESIEQGVESAELEVEQE